jgi:hypothetical protein
MDHNQYTKNHKMNIDQQIRDYEKKIARLEEFRRKGDAESGLLEKHLDEHYQQIALLKIRKMMGY